MAKRPPALDRIDIKILAALQRNGRMTIQKLAGVAGLTPRPCLERVRRLEAAGIIAGYQAVLALERLSNPVTIFAEIVLEKQGRQDRLEKRLITIEEVVDELRSPGRGVLFYACRSYVVRPGSWAFGVANLEEGKCQWVSG